MSDIESNVVEEPREHIYEDGVPCWCGPEIHNYGEETASEVFPDLEPTGDSRFILPEPWALTKEQYLRFYGLEQAVKFSAAISTPDAAMSIDQMKMIADQFVEYVRGDE